MEATILPADPYPTPMTLWFGSNSTFSEYGHVAPRIEEFYISSNKVANILPTDPPAPGDGVSRSSFNFFRTWSCNISNKRESPNAAAS